MAQYDALIIAFFFLNFSSCIDGIEAPGWNFVVMEGEVSWQSPDVTVLAQFQEAVIDQRHDELIENRGRMAELMVVDDWCWPYCWTHHSLRLGEFNCWTRIESMDLLGWPI